ncbi:conserved domain protein [Sporolactobacillus inulinus]|uniref:Conserved domain protein n=1 Tax=Sporolactobacillus inulinus TaxID=2078 RepID=A0A4Y1ZE51_9BACL|nr:hypothetical protein [Sporolactobacillus inulinus]GAY77375.1 conserved domain protein [Sporolactobacillus inulinus]
MLALTLNPFVWKKNIRNKRFIAAQTGRLVLGLLLVFLTTYFRLIDHTWQAFLSYGSLFWGFFLLLDMMYKKEKTVSVNAAAGLLLLLFFAYLHFLYPLTVTKAKYDLRGKTTIVAKPEASMDEQHIPVVPEKYARYKSEKVLGELSHVSYYELGHTSLQKLTDIFIGSHQLNTAAFLSG